MDVEMNVGISFGGASLNSSSSQTVTQATTDTYTQTVLVTAHYDCTSPDYKESIGLWQWHTTSHDGSYEARTNKFLCRFGAISDNAPECPYGSCANNDCSVCDAW